MPAERTEVTEIVTGLAMLGFSSLDHALAIRPHVLYNVTDGHFDRLAASRGAGHLDSEFALAWENGLHFARADDGLRGRPPWRVEWKGPHRPPGYDQLPADLRVDHVYLISCKYGSSILLNASPTHLFDRLLAERRVEGGDWFLEVAAPAYQEFYEQCRLHVGDARLPAKVSELRRSDRLILKRALKGRLPEPVEEAYRWFAISVSHESAHRLRDRLSSVAAQEEMLWRLLRLQPAPYFVLGATTRGQPIRYRVGTPWDFRSAYRLDAFDSWAEAVGQPLVRWRADVFDREEGSTRSIEGHVEIRWSHGRFAQVPEAKVYLDTPPYDVPGYSQMR